MPEQRVAVITGAGSGIGRAAAVALAERGFACVLVGRRREKLEETASLLRGASGEPSPSHVLPADISRSDEAERMIAESLKAFGRIDALVNNAGDAPLKGIGETPPDLLDRAFAVNALGPGYAIYYAWPAMMKGGGGRIVNVSTKGTADPFPGFFAYAAAKAAVNVYAMSIAKEGKKHNILGFSVAPGATETPMIRRHWSERVLPPSQVQSPETVAAVIAACAAGERDADNGSTIFVIHKGA